MLLRSLYLLIPCACVAGCSIPFVPIIWYSNQWAKKRLKVSLALLIGAKYTIVPKLLVWGLNEKLSFVFGICGNVVVQYHWYFQFQSRWLVQYRTWVTQRITSLCNLNTSSPRELQIHLGSNLFIQVTSGAESWNEISWLYLLWWQCRLLPSPQILVIASQK